MKINILLSFFLIYYYNSFSQVLSNNFNIEYGNYDNCETNQMNFWISGHVTSQVNNLSTNIKLNLLSSKIKAGEYILLNPGISVEATCDLSSTLLEIKNTPPCPAAILNSSDAIISKYEKIEIGIRPSDNILNRIEDYFLPIPSSTSINPYNSENTDQDYIDVVCTFMAPDGTSRIINGFYYRPYNEDMISDSWHEMPTEYPFRVRFSPDQVGLWHVKIDIISHYQLEGYGLSPYCSVTYQNTANSFLCISNPTNLGPLMVGHHRRHLKFADGSKSFFPIGQNVSQTNSFNPTPSVYFNQQKIGFDKIHDAGGNTTRIFMSGWSFSPQSAYLNTQRFSYFNQVGTGILGNYDERQKHMGVLDEMLETLHDYNIYSILALFHFPIFQYSNPWSNSSYSTPLWFENEFNSANQFIIPNINTPKNYFQSVECKKLTKKIIKYLISRWGYQSHLLSWQIFNEIDNVAYYKADLINNIPADPSIQAAIYDWQTEMASYIKQIDLRRHLVTTSYAGEPTAIDLTYQMHDIDYVTGHSYAHNFNCDRWDRQNKVEYYLNGPFGKPVLLDEIGSDYPATMEDFTNSNFHNSTWASMFMGSMGGGLNYWWSSIALHNGQNDFQGMQQFISNVDFESNKFEPVNYSNGHLTDNNGLCDGHIEYFALKNYSSTKIMGWLHNRTFYWGNENNSNIGYCNPTIPCNWNSNDPQEIPLQCNSIQWTGNQQTIGGENMKFTGLPWGRKYRIDWYISTGSTLVYAYTTTKKVNFLWHLNLSPPWTWGGQSDFAFKIRKNGDPGWRTTASGDEPEIEEEDDRETMCVNESFCIPDTMYLSEDSLKAFPYTYYWNFGNGTSSNSPTPCFSYSAEGNYFMYATVYDGLDLIDSIYDTLFVIQCNMAKHDKNSIGNSGDLNAGIVNVFPNPGSDEFTIQLKENYFINSLALFSQQGVVVFEKNNCNDALIHFNSKIITPGIYIFRIQISDGSIYFKKIIKL